MKNKIISCLVIFIAIVFLTLPPFKISAAYGDIVKGNVSGDGQVNLQDAILVLQVISGMTPSATIYKQGDVNGDQRIGGEEAIYILQEVAGLRTAINGGVELTINSLSTTSAVPASLLTISGSGFDPANAAISVLFTPNGSGAPIAVPVFSASASSIKVIVPPFLDRTSGFSSGVMTVQAIQVSGSFLMTSNTIGGLNVGSLPSIPTSNPAGAVTGAWINSGLLVLQNIQTFAGSTPSYADLLSASNALGSDLNSSLQAINSIIANPTQTKNLTTLNGTPFVLDAATLAASDRLVVAYLQQFLNLVQTPPADSPTSVVPPRSALAAGCVVDTDPVTGSMICDGRTYNQQFAQVGSAILPSAAAFVYGQWLSLAGAFGAAGFLAAGVSEAAVNAFQLVWAASGPYVAALAAGGPAPPLKEPATEVATTLIDNVLNGAGTVLSGVLFAADLFSTANQVSSAPMGSAPTGGLIVFDATTQPPPGSNALLRVQGFGDNASVLSVMAPKSQATLSLCTFSYSDWSPCQPNNTQTRTVISSTPAGCVGTPVLSQCTYTPNTIPIFRGTAVTTMTDLDPWSATSDWYHCLPDPVVTTGTVGPFTVDLVLDANPLVLGPISGTLYLGSSTMTVTSPQMTCTRTVEGYPRVWTVPANTITETVPSDSVTISGHSDGTNIVIDTSIDLPSYCSETFTGTVTTAPVTGAVQFSGQDILTCLIDGKQMVSTTTYSLTRQ